MIRFFHSLLFSLTSKYELVSTKIDYYLLKKWKKAKSCVYSFYDLCLMGWFNIYDFLIGLSIFHLCIFSLGRVWAFLSRAWAYSFTCIVERIGPDMISNLYSNINQDELFHMGILKEFRHYKPFNTKWFLIEWKGPLTKIKSLPFT